MLKSTENHMMLDDKTYNVVKKLVQVILPAFGALYFGLANIWGLPAAEQVVGTIAVVTTFLGVCLGVSARQYDASGAAFDGSMVVSQPEDGKKVFSLELDIPPEEIEDKDSIAFKVDKCPPTTEDAIPVQTETYP